MKLIYTLFILVLSISLFGQKMERKANILYDQFGYQTSIPMYEQAIYDQSGNVNVTNLERIATSCRLTHDTQNAEKWYAELLKYANNPVNYLYYAQALQSNGKLEEAKRYYLLYDRVFGINDQRGQLLAAAIGRMSEFEKEQIQIKNETNINSEKLDFSPTYYNNGIVFVSNRKIQPYYYRESNKDIWLDDKYMSLFYAEKQIDGKLKLPRMFSLNLTSRYHEGPLCFSKDGQQIFFTRNNFINGKKTKSESGVIHLKIYTATKKGFDWVNIHELPFSTDEFDESHPSLSPDGQHLIFASNRTGGFGGMDLYVSKLSKGIWGKPTNLGPTVNTSGNEIFPFIHDDGTLYFASDGLGGIGGLDIFSSEPLNENWQKPINLGVPINSSKDDFGFILNVLGTEGYFSSARGNSGLGKDDIYSFRAAPNTLKRKYKTQFLANICVFDQKDQTRISEANVNVYKKRKDGSLERQSGDRLIRLIPRNNQGEYTLKLELNTPISNENKTYFTNADGEFSIPLESNQEYVFIANKGNYITAQKTFTTEGLSAIEELSFCIPMEVDQVECINIEGVVVNKIHGNLIPNAKVILLNNCTGEKAEYTSNLLGEFAFYCLPRNCNYELIASKEGFEEASKILPKEDFSLLTKSKHYTMELYSKNEKDLFAGNSSVKESNGKHIIGIGSSIVLEDIYYDFDKYNIRTDAQKILNDLTGLLRQYPSLELDLVAHTDSRGTDAYNQRLSDKRAKKAFQYLVNKGIKAHRLRYHGEGEKFLRNHCKDGVSCSETAHQYNRRTEIKVIKFDQKDISLSQLK